MNIFLKSIKDSFRYIKPSLILAWESSPALCAGVSVLTLGAALLPLGMAYVGKLIIDAVVAKQAMLTLKFIGLETAVMLLQSAVLQGLSLCQLLLGAKLGTDVNIKILEKAVTLELRHFEDSEIYDQLTKARRQASLRPSAMVTDSLQLIQNAVTFFGYVGVLFVLSPGIVLGLVVASIPATISEMKFSQAAFRLRNWRSPDTRKLNYLEVVLATDEHAKEIKVLGLSKLFLNRYRELGTQFYEEDKVLAIKRSKWAFVLSRVSALTFYGCYAWMGYGCAMGLMTLGSLTLYMVAFKQGQQAFQSCLTAIGNMYESNLYMSNLFDYFNIKTSQSEPNHHIHNPSSAVMHTDQKGIRFENVGFRYEGKTQWALRNINLDIPSQKSLALVGHNGAGKSTFIKLLCRLYTPTEGRILLDGIDLQHWDLEALHKRIGVVFQDFNQYQLKLKENVGVGQVEYLDDDAKVELAVQKGGANSVVESLEKGLETPLGRWFNGGLELSGGQWQKIALSRGFMRETADILILDEPTAALDAEAEQAVFERFRELTLGKTSILISHRFPTVRMADTIVVLEGGQIMEQGTHDELIALEGRYAHLFTLQAQGYL